MSILLRKFLASTERLAGAASILGASAIAGFVGGPPVIAAAGAALGAESLRKLLGAALGAAGSALVGKVAETGYAQTVRRLSRPSAVLRNEDLTHLVGRSIHVVLDAKALETEKHSPEVAKAYRAVGAAAERLWSNIATSPDLASVSESSIESLAEAELAGIFARDPSAFPPTLTPETWAQLLDYFASEARVDLSEVSRSTLSLSLSTESSRAIYELLKDDLKKGGRAFAGYLIHAVAAITADVADTRTRVEAIAGLLFAGEDRSSRRYFRTFQRLEWINDGVERLSQRQDSIHAELAAIPDRCAAALERVLAADSDLARELAKTIAGRLRFEVPRVEIRLQRKQRRTDDPDGSRFAAHQRRIPLLARDTELATLTDWMASDESRPVTIAVITGDAGAGKTRLAIELCDRARAVGWHAGFLDSDGLASLLAQTQQRPWMWDLPTLIVIDYAANVRDEIDRLLTHLEGREDLAAGPPLRVLLVERHGEADAPWWQHAIGSPRRRSWNVDGQFDVHLAGFGSGEARDALIRAALVASEGWGRPGLSQPTDERVSRVRSALDAIERSGLQRKGSTPLIVQLVSDLIDTLPSSGVVDRDAVLRAWRGREVHQRLRPLLLRSGRPGAADQLERFELAIGVATLAQGELPADVAALLPEPAMLSEAGSPESKAAAAATLADFCGRADGHLRPLEPDLLGEYWFLETVLRLPAVSQQALMQAVPAAGAARGVGFLIRTAIDFPENTAVASFLHALASDVRTPVPALAAALDGLPEHSVALRPLAAQLTSSLVAKYELEGSSPSVDPSERAGALNNLSVRLSEVGRREDALKAIEEATQLYRALAKAQPDAFVPDLAMSLNNLANRLSEVGRREDALKAIEEATQLYRALAKAQPDAFVPDLAMSLNNLANLLSEVGRREDALKAIEEAVQIRRALAKAQPDAFVPDLAMSLNNLANRLSEVGRREDALKAIEEAVQIRRALAKAQPDAFVPNLAGSLNNLANRLSEVGRREDALKAIEEATQLYRTLAKAQPDAFVPDLAMSLNNLAIRLSEVGRREDALKAIEEAVQIRRALAKAQPDAFVPDLAMSLNNLANRLSEVGRREDALKAIEEAVQIRRALAKAQPDAFVPNLAGSLNNLANRLSEVGRREDALKAIEEATQLYRTLAKAQPDAFVPDLAMSLNNLAIRLSEVGRREDAVKAIEEAVQIRRALAKAQPDAFVPDLAMSLNNLANLLSEVGRREDALKAIEEATQLYRALAKAQPDAFVPDLAMSLNNLANRLSEVGRREDALKAIEEATQLYRALAKAQPDAFVPDLAMSLNNLANLLSEVGRREDALKAIEEATQLYRALAKAQPDAFVPNLAGSLNNLANRLSEVGRREDALKAIEEATQLYRTLAKAQPDAFVPDLAMSLNNLANLLSEVGRREDALKAIEEAEDAWNWVSEALRPSVARDVARACGAHALILSTLERPADATAKAAEGLAILLDAAVFDAERDCGLAKALGALHFQSAQAANAEPNMALLSRLLQMCPAE